ncbi:MAG TPA: hypothetical protein VMT35_04535 [Ignavibacteriaceae bacterium]|nr:hypothetical protein [Ignavibacteriaceae bacterium]
MKRNYIFCFSWLVVFFSITSAKAFAFQNAETSEVVGQWGGYIEYAERLEAVNIVFKNVDNVLSGTITLVYDKKNLPLENISLKGSKIEFTGKYDNGISFNGEIAGNKLKGTIRINTPYIMNVNGKFELTKGKLIEEDILFLERLRAFSEYKNERVNSKYKFSYMDSSDTNLRKLKSKYNLDSIAGRGDEKEKIINLMKWVHNVRPYDGHSGYIKPANSLNLLECEMAKKKGLSCFMKSIILNDVYLAMGYHSRVVHCMPKGNNFIEDHYINMVYSKKLKKWIFMDSAVGGYFEDENGILLSIQEVRQKLINGDTLVLNNDAELPDFIYLHYLSKNLFRFECSFTSEFNFESKEKKVYCRLNPKSYADSVPKKNDDIIMSNPDFFWLKP